ncbi:hypothetical protein EHP00_2362 [Ecytonucleospora hepatopenaei]|uniref:Uncharacterized protein n=1 Tax=Ecytonucleospora hepatopenaei TaxID=646526 RepID=A0A1W0E7T7_9MICR|nr:hypothetical protein EHP00_2362 [Ecytonucleospora hepatopenaei]
MKLVIMLLNKNIIQTTQSTLELEWESSSSSNKTSSDKTSSDKTSSDKSDSDKSDSSIYSNSSSSYNISKELNVSNNEFNDLLKEKSKEIVHKHMIHYKNIQVKKVK